MRTSRLCLLPLGIVLGDLPPYLFYLEFNLIISPSPPLIRPLLTH